MSGRLSPIAKNRATPRRSACRQDALFIARTKAGGARLVGAPSFARRFGQFGSGPVELSAPVTLDEADTGGAGASRTDQSPRRRSAMGRGGRVLRQVMESHGAKDDRHHAPRYVSVADYCHVQIAALPAEGSGCCIASASIRWRRPGTTTPSRGATRRDWPKWPTRCFVARRETTRFICWVRWSFERGHHGLCG